MAIESASRASRGPAKGRASVGFHLVVAFSLCLFTLAAVMTLTTASSFRRERAQARLRLRTAAEAAARAAADAAPAVIRTLQGVVSQPGISALDPGECQEVLDVFANVARSGRVNLFRTDGSTVCALRQPNLSTNEVAKGPWFDEALASGQPVNAGTAIDPVTGRPALTVALGFEGSQGRRGVLGAIFYTDAAALTLPAGTPPGTVLLLLDADRRLLLRTSAGAPFKPGLIEPSSPLARAVGTDVRTSKDPDGVTRYQVEEVVADRGLHLLAGLSRGVALAPARAELRRNLWLGGAVLVAVAGLGMILHRRLARPIRRLREAIEAASHDDTAQAVVEGPAEIAAVAEAFNTTIGQRRQLESQLAHQALHDPLTGLPNRALLTDRLSLAIARQSRRRGSAGRLLPRPRPLQARQRQPGPRRRRRSCSSAWPPAPGRHAPGRHRGPLRR